MADSIYRVTELVGTSSESWEQAAASAVETASQTLRDLRIAEVAYFDEQGQPVAPDEVPLTPAGRRQAQRAGAALAGAHSRLDRRWSPPGG